MDSCRLNSFSVLASIAFAALLEAALADMSQTGYEKHRR